MRRKNPGFEIITTLLLFLVSGCVDRRPGTLPQTESPSQIFTEVVSPTSTKENATPLNPITVPTSSVTPSLTPLPTLISSPTAIQYSQQEVMNWLKEIMRDNGGCQLPCWWGIEPGQTTWSEAQALLFPYASLIDEIEGENKLFTGVFFFAPPPDISLSMIYLGFEVDEEIVQGILVDGIDEAQSFDLPTLMDRLGQPSSVWVNGYSGSANDFGPRQMSIHIFYAEKGLLAQYEAPSGTEENGILRNCVEFGPDLDLYQPNPNISYQVAQQKLGLHIQFPYLPSKIAIGMDTSTFYEQFKAPNQNICFESPVEIWKWP